VTGIRPNLIRAETVRLIDMVLESMADGRLDRVSLRKLPPWRAVVLARVAHRAHLMPRDELDALTEEVIRVGVDGRLEQYPSEPVEPEPELGWSWLPALPARRAPRLPLDAPEWTQRGMIQESVPRRQTGSRHPSR
jgi:hypothetical protein